MADYKFSLFVDLVGTETNELDEKLMKGRERNFYGLDSGFVRRNSRDYEFRYTKHCDAVRAGKRVIKLLAAEGERHGVVYVLNPDGTTESLTLAPTTVETQKKSPLEVTLGLLRKAFGFSKNG